MAEQTVRRPRIGITADDGDMDEYLRAVERAGGDPQVLAPDVDRVLDDVREFAGIVFSGGADLDPRHYGEAAHAHTRLESPARDDYELALARAVVERSLPTLAICRGLQVANVAFGGTLHQHVPDVAGERIPHRVRLPDGSTDRRPIAEHILDVEPDSRLARLVGPALVTGSRHHQAIARVAEPFFAVARSRDGLIEALELTGASWFWLGVQWHPESTLDADAGASLALFRALIAAAAAGPA
ncbi:MAG: gamma-glutamyl-gamma-aminobutyrate hydrolase family protein [Candidatus Velthaea sp.]|jgi:putative glutamine amidotransferase